MAIYVEKKQTYFTIYWMLIQFYARCSSKACQLTATHCEFESHVTFDIFINEKSFYWSLFIQSTFTPNPNTKLCLLSHVGSSFFKWRNDVIVASERFIAHHWEWIMVLWVWDTKTSSVIDPFDTQPIPTITRRLLFNKAVLCLTGGGVMMKLGR